MKKGLKSFLLIVALILTISLSGCNTITQFFAIEGGHFFNESSLVNLPFDYMTVYEDRPWGENIEYNTEKYIVSSKAQLDEMFGETYSKSYSEEEQAHVRDERFTNLMNSFDEEYFIDNQLVFFFVEAAGGAYYFELLNTNYNEGVLTIILNHKSSGAGTAALVPKLAIIETEKTPEDTTVEVVIEGRNW